ncbi:G2/mitotic-specific cyclin-B3 isoform X2 [Periplaneta americana]|uniref:G2/mitotic-specific cyclin-B3 isoform X2 n=1 Tax=Periplaneta americana TaxID=6978 RepID=UPI0037E75244
MGPIQNTTQQSGTTTSRKGAITRSLNNTNKKEGKKMDMAKRKADNSPKQKTLKRSAFGDITNALGKNIVVQDTKKVPVTKPLVKSRAKVAAKVSVPVTSRNVPGQQIVKTQAAVKKLPVASKPKVVTIQKKEEIKNRPRSQGSKQETKEETSVLPELQSNTSSKDSSSDSSFCNDSCNHSEQPETVPSQEPPGLESSSIPLLPDSVKDFDEETHNDPYQVSLYAMDIFNYLKERESLFKVEDYMDRQPSVSQWMRSLLVDWMVEVQESFELNHETLYLAVKLVDLYLAKIVVRKETLQLIGAAAMFISCKFDERIPPQVEDFLYICDGAYTHRELIRMEANVLKVVDFNLGIPLSYRFLRRYARCAKLSLETLTLARYILEFSLMEYAFVTESSSKLAAASLLLALKTKFLGGWTQTLQYYSGYKLEDIRELAHNLNGMLHKKPKAALATVRNKYSHKIFFEVAKIPLLEKLDI